MPNHVHLLLERQADPLGRIMQRILTGTAQSWNPMAGSGTTLVEAVLAGRNAMGIDLDPLAVLIAQIKSTEWP